MINNNISEKIELILVRFKHGNKSLQQTKKDLLILLKQTKDKVNKCYLCGKEHNKVAFCNKCEKDLTDAQRLKYLEVPLTDIALQEIHKMKKRLLEND